KHYKRRPKRKKTTATLTSAQPRNQLEEQMYQDDPEFMKELDQTIPKAIRAAEKSKVDESIPKTRKRRLITQRDLEIGEARQEEEDVDDGALIDDMNETIISLKNKRKGSEEAGLSKQQRK